MTQARSQQLFTRHEGNPILTALDWPYTVNAVFNPGATTGPDGDTILLVRVEDRAGLSHLTVARSRDGLNDWKIDTQPSFAPQTSTYAECWGVEDPRITKVGDEYLIAHTAVSRSGPLVSLVSTTDFVDFTRRAIVSPPENKDAALFPVKFDDRYAMIHRPVYFADGGAAHMWISYSPDLRHWGDHRILMESRRSGYWDRDKVGLGPPPLRTDQGWLIMFHGVRDTAAGALYRAGLAVLDLEEPTTVLARADEWVLGPEVEYERMGDVPGVVFPCGWIADDDGMLRLYYGAADTCVAVATARIDDLVAFAFSHTI
ncbi:MAG TPA: glycosidase [Acidimicrobiia bacterium]|jgi:predicted GH43/DUF377 family glycosyl hydrolase